MLHTLFLIIILCGLGQTVESADNRAGRKAKNSDSLHQPMVEFGRMNGAFNLDKADMLATGINSVDHAPLEQDIETQYEKNKNLEKIEKNILF